MWIDMMNIMNKMRITPYTMVLLEDRNSEV